MKKTSELRQPLKKKDYSKKEGPRDDAPLDQHVQINQDRVTLFLTHYGSENLGVLHSLKLDEHLYLPNYSELQAHGTLILRLVWISRFYLQLIPLSKRPVNDRC